MLHFFYTFWECNLPDPGIKPGSLTFHADSLPFEPPGKPSKQIG